MKKSAIPSVLSLDQELARVLEPIKNNLEIITGARPGTKEITKLATTATLTDVIAKVNEVVARLNQNG
jgi:hypothetical protein